MSTTLNEKVTEKELQDARNAKWEAESNSGFTSKEREKILAIALMFILENHPSGRPLVVELETLWKISQYTANSIFNRDNVIPDLNMERVFDIYANPAKYRNYK